MTKVNIFYLTPNPYGGWATFVYHLTKSLDAIGVEWKLYKVGNRTENKTRPFVNGLWYRNLSMEDAVEMAMSGPTIIAASAKRYFDACQNLFFEGAKLVVHDPCEFKFLPLTVRQKQDQCVVIRSMGKHHLPGATFIRHPYSPVIYPQNKLDKTKLAVSVSRIDFDKRTTILLDANRVARENGWELIDIRGFENRLYTRFKVVPFYPEWVQSVNHFEKEAGTAEDLLRSARFMPDMSYIAEDGGGTQYTFLEAWNSGAVPVIHDDWVVEGDDMVPGFNCYAVADGHNLAELMNKIDEEDRVRVMHNGFSQMGRNHDPIVIGCQYQEFLGV